MSSYLGLDRSLQLRNPIPHHVKEFFWEKPKLPLQFGDLGQKLISFLTRKLATDSRVYKSLPDSTESTPSLSISSLPKFRLVFGTWNRRLVRLVRLVELTREFDNLGRTAIVVQQGKIE